ncbi:uncharacterized protein LOC108623631 isoform X2 [Ceratina calcarata]|uniref:Uncharacterized protein LOC108623631 isoform X2 n=1 Tax=Ceratina calcarata TaxID=156304 RepID=A0AAJ7N4X4_9HYME|nr:uncharacterized protein LOC108623631 isoform X2 [Ceratina calcarata]
MQYDKRMDIYSTVSIEDCVWKELDEVYRLNAYLNLNFNYCASVFKKALRKVPNILKNSTKLHRMSRTKEIRGENHAYDASEQAAENSIVKQENKIQLRRSTRRKQQLLPLQIVTHSNGWRKKSNRRSNKSRKRRTTIRHNSEGETSVVVKEPKIEYYDLTTDLSPDCQKIECYDLTTDLSPDCPKIECYDLTTDLSPDCPKIGCYNVTTDSSPDCPKIECYDVTTDFSSDCPKIECYDVTTDFNPDCPTPSLLQEIDARVLKDSIDFTSNEIFNTFHYEFFDNNLNSTMEMIPVEVDSSYNICDSSGVDINDNECKLYQVVDDENKESISADKSNDNECNSYQSADDENKESISADKSNDNECNVYQAADDEDKQSISTDKPNDNECNAYQTADDENKESISADKSISSEYLGIDSDFHCNSCPENCVLNTIEHEMDDLKEDLEVETLESVDEDSYVNNINEETSINLTVEKGDFLFTDINSTLITLIDSTGEVAEGTMFDAVPMDQPTINQGENSICDSCGMLSSQIDNFNEHLEACRANKPYKCEICMRPYRYKSSLYKHIRVKHYHPINDGSDLYTCKVCNKVYCKFGHFLTHIAIHEEYF